jgi:hypothetical protein
MAALRDEGCQLGWLGTGINDWYRRLGWENGGEDWVFTLDRATVNLLPALEAELGVGPWHDSAAMLALHEAAGPGAWRSREWFDVLLQRPGLTCCTAARDGTLLAYILFKGMHVYEQAGDSTCILGLLREAFTRRDERDKPTSTTQHLGTMTVRTAPARAGCAATLVNLGLPCKRDYNGMWWIPDLPALLHALNLPDITAETHDNRVTLRRGEESATLTPGEVVKLILGPERIAPFAQDIFPIGHYMWLFDWV